MVCQMLQRLLGLSYDGRTIITWHGRHELLQLVVLIKYVEGPGQRAGIHFRGLPQCHCLASTCESLRETSRIVVQLVNNPAINLPGNQTCAFVDEFDNTSYHIEADEQCRVLDYPENDR